MLPYLDRPLVQDYLPAFWVILLATLLRIAADSYGFMLLALHRDRAIALIALSGAIASALLNLVLTPLAGLWGASLAYVLTSAGLFAARYALCRPGLPTKDPDEADLSETEASHAVLKGASLP